MKELDSISAHLQKMLQREDSSGGESENGLIDSLRTSCNFREGSSPSNAVNSAPRALIAYAGR